MKSSYWVVNLPLQALVKVFGVSFIWVDYLCGKREVKRSFGLADAGDIRSMSALYNELIF